MIIATRLQPPACQGVFFLDKINLERQIPQHLLNTLGDDFGVFV